MAEKKNNPTIFEKDNLHVSMKNCITMNREETKQQSTKTTNKHNNQPI
jgi:hypothetical protein